MYVESKINFLLCLQLPLKSRQCNHHVQISSPLAIWECPSTDSSLLEGTRKDCSWSSQEGAEEAKDRRIRTGSCCLESSSTESEGPKCCCHPNQSSRGRDSFLLAAYYWRSTTGEYQPTNHPLRAVCLQAAGTRHCAAQEWLNHLSTCGGIALITELPITGHSTLWLMADRLDQPLLAAGG